MTERPNVLIVCPAHDHRVFVSTSLAITRLVVALMEHKIQSRVLYLSGDAIVSRVRNGAIAEFMSQPNATHLLFLDSDIDFDPMTVIRMLKSGFPFTCAAYPKKTYPNADARLVDARDLKSFHEAVLDWNVVFEDEAVMRGTARPAVTHNGFAKVLKTGAGLMLLQRKVVATMVERFKSLRYKDDIGNAGGSGYRYNTSGFGGYLYGLFDPFVDPKTDTFVGEDYAFCQRWVDECGGEIWCDLSARLSHWGPHSYSGTLFETLSVRRRAQQRREDAAGGKTPPTVRLNVVPDHAVAGRR